MCPIFRRWPLSRAAGRFSNMGGTMKKLPYFFLLVFLLCGSALAQVEPARVTHLETRVSSLEQNIKQFASEGMVLTLFAAFCALWAQQTGRNAWLWFFVGGLFSVITVLVLLWKNAEDINRRRPTA